MTVHSGLRLPVPASPFPVSRGGRPGVPVLDEPAEAARGELDELLLLEEEGVLAAARALLEVADLDRAPTGRSPGHDRHALHPGSFGEAGRMEGRSPETMRARQRSGYCHPEGMISTRRRKTSSGLSPGVSMTATMPLRQRSSLTRSRRSPPGTDSDPFVTLMAICHDAGRPGGVELSGPGGAAPPRLRRPSRAGGRPRRRVRWRSCRRRRACRPSSRGPGRRRP